jgi:hypothetical protein
MAKPLHEASRGPIQEPLDPSQPVSGHFKSLLQALALRLPDLTRPFFLYVSERQGFALGVLEQYHTSLNNWTPQPGGGPHALGPWRLPLS